MKKIRPNAESKPWMTPMQAIKIWLHYPHCNHMNTQTILQAKWAYFNAKYKFCHIMKIEFTTKQVARATVVPTMALPT